MKKMSMLFLFAFTFYSYAGYFDSPKEVRHALDYGADTKLIFSVTDDERKPIDGVEVSGCFCMNKSGNNPIYKGVTAKDGKCILTGKSVGEIFYTLRKNHYYETRGRIWLAGSIQKPGEVKDGKWFPYGNVYEVVLKPKKNPIKMIEYSCKKRIPAECNLIGYDLKCGDFVKPYGNGDVSDFLICHQEEILDENRSISEMELIFQNALDGAHIMKKDMYSQFTTCYSARTNLNYEKRVSFRYDSSDLSDIKKNRLEYDQYLVLRTRTRVDMEGKLLEAHYSKIQGPIKFGGRRLEFYSYFNPTINDKNLESQNKVYP